MTKKVAVFLVLLLVVGVTPGWSICGPIKDWVDEKAASDNYGAKSLGMLLRGIHGVVEVPLEITHHLIDGTLNEKPYVIGTLKGLGTGAAHAVETAMIGAWDVITALCPRYKGLPREHEHELFKFGGGATA